MRMEVMMKRIVESIEEIKPILDKFKKAVEIVEELLQKPSLK